MQPAHTPVDGEMFDLDMKVVAAYNEIRPMLRHLMDVLESWSPKPEIQFKWLTPDAFKMSGLLGALYDLEAIDILSKFMSQHGFTVKWLDSKTYYCQGPWKVQIMLLGTADVRCRLLFHHEGG